MKNIILFIVIMLLAVSANAVTVTCIDEGNNIVRIDYIASSQAELPIAFALNITVNNGAVIQNIYDYKVGDSTAASPGFGIFPGNIQFDLTGQVTDWGSPDMKTASPGILPGIGTMGVTLVMNSRYSGQENAPLLTGTLCKLTINTGGAQTVNVQIAANTKAGGVLLANGSNALFNGVGCVLQGSTPPNPTAPPAPSSIGYPASDNDGSYVVQWSSSNGATSYRLERSANSGSTWQEIYYGPAITYSEQISNGSYSYRVRAENASGSSDWKTGSWNCLVSTSEPPSTPVTVIIDNLDSNTSSVGSWAVSGAKDAWATNSFWSRSSGGSFTFNASLVPGATYEVYEWHTYWPSRYTAVPHLIQDGATLLDTISVNQTQNTGQWHYLGTYTFANGSASVTIQVAPAATGTQWSTNADAVRFVPTEIVPPPATPTAVIVDNLDSDTSSVQSWSASGAKGAWATNSFWSRSSGGSFTFNASLVPGATYEVYEWHTYWPSRYTAVPHLIQDGATLLDTISVNQTQNTGQWHYLGTYTFANGSASVTIQVDPAATGTQWSTNADAIKFVPVP